MRHVYYKLPDVPYLGLNTMDFVIKMSPKWETVLVYDKRSGKYATSLVCSVAATASSLPKLRHVTPRREPRAASRAEDRTELDYTSRPDRFISERALSQACFLRARRMRTRFRLPAIPERDCVTRSGLKRVVFNISYGDTQDSVAPQEQPMNY